MRPSSPKLFLLDGMFFEWDVEKAELNVRRHGVTFQEAASVFGDKHGRIFQDPDHSWDETRFLLVRLSSSKRFLIVVSAERGERATDQCMEGDHEEEKGL